jgi:hypothetical protein
MGTITSSCDPLYTCSDTATFPTLEEARAHETQIEVQAGIVQWAGMYGLNQNSTATQILNAMVLHYEDLMNEIGAALTRVKVV